jgi:hypothetical protein
MAEISKREQRQIDQANASGNTPVVFIHGLRPLPSSWDSWVGPLPTTLPKRSVGSTRSPP